MTDTSVAIEERYRAMLMRRSGAERLKMGCSMFESARRLVRASLGDPTGTDDSAEMKVQLFRRIYGADFNPVTAARVVAYLRRSS